MRFFSDERLSDWADISIEHDTCCCCCCSCCCGTVRFGMLIMFFSFGSVVSMFASASRFGRLLVLTGRVARCAASRNLGCAAALEIIPTAVCWLFNDSLGLSFIVSCASSLSFEPWRDPAAPKFGLASLPSAVSLSVSVLAASLASLDAGNLGAV